MFNAETRLLSDRLVVFAIQTAQADDPPGRYRRAKRGSIIVPSVVDGKVCLNERGSLRLPF